MVYCGWVWWRSEKSAIEWGAKDGVERDVVECGGVWWSGVECGGLVMMSVVECGGERSVAVVWINVVQWDGVWWSGAVCGGVERSVVVLER